MTRGSSRRPSIIMSRINKIILKSKAGHFEKYISDPRQGKMWIRDDVSEVRGERTRGDKG